MKTIAVLGATGNVGMQALDVALCRGYAVDFLSGGRNEEMMEHLARRYRPSAVAMADPDAAKGLKLRLKDTSVKVLSSEEGILCGIADSSADTFVNSILGEAGLMPTLAVVDSGKRLALANKESLVIAGDIVMSRAREKGCEIIPVDSEHSAIFQSLHAGRREEVKSIILTASGGPFFGKTRRELESVTLEDTLAHPTWSMGKKITVDSATLMNKGFEVIEAVHLFGVPSSRVKVIVHRESILHSAVEYIDNTVIGEFSVPDMRMCVQYAVDYPDRCIGSSEPLDLFKVGALTFREPDRRTFPFLALAQRASAMGGAMCAVLNAADEVAVASFLKGELSFIGIIDCVSETFERLAHLAEAKDLESIIRADRECRIITAEVISAYNARKGKI